MSFIDFNWWPTLIPLIPGFLGFKYFNKSFKILFLYVVYSALNEVVVFTVRHAFHIKNTMPFSNIYIIVSFGLLAFYYFFIFEKFVKKGLLLFFILGFLVLSIINILFIQSWFVYPFIFSSVRCILLVAFSLIYFYKILIEDKIENLWKDGRIWINTGLLIYFSGILFYTVLFNLILEYSRDFSKMTVVYYLSTLNTLLYILIAIGFWKAKKEVKIAKKLERV